MKAGIRTKKEPKVVRSCHQPGLTLQLGKRQDLTPLPHFHCDPTSRPHFPLIKVIPSWFASNIIPQIIAGNSTATTEIVMPSFRRIGAMFVAFSPHNLSNIISLIQPPVYAKLTNIGDIAMSKGSTKSSPGFIAPEAFAK